MMGGNSIRYKSRAQEKAQEFETESGSQKQESEVEKNDFYSSL